MTYRYAIYYAPDDGPLRAAADSWLGPGAAPDGPTRAAADGFGPAAGGWTRDEVDAITRDARRYGFHATLKAPFRLAPGHTLTELRERLGDFAGRRGPVVAPELRLACLAGFFALVTGRHEPALHALADDVVRDFDDLRAPATDAEIARRRPERLDDQARALLLTYGYPHVLDRFLFHLTLTDAVPMERREHVQSVLTQHFAGVLGQDLVLSSLALFVEPDAGQPFQLVESYPFKGAQ
ncbi:DUF1045 domain-containing protein [Cryptosporangium sp. NPDC048952]|uniref:DUF1045 domain-containing protein n=1 Tax=Cryptosporangium sp. NPDC048952 TaxID=3363961 RepID=UPI003724352F